MQLTIITPNRVLSIEMVSKLIGEDLNGSFGILPKHIDFVTKIVPSVLIYVDEQGEGYIAVDEGILVKQSRTIQISVKEALESRNLGELHKTMEKQFQKRQEEEKHSEMERSKLEIGIVRSLYDLEALSKQ